MSWRSPVARVSARRKPGRRPQRPHHRRLGQHQGEDLGARDAEGAKGADQGPALHHRERHGVVDEEHADEEGEERERGQVQRERPRHARGAVGARAGRHELGPGRHGGGDPLQQGLAGGIVGHDQVDAGEAAGRPQELLGRRDVGDEQALHGARAQGIRRLEKAGDAHRAPRARHAQGQRVAGAKPELARGGPRHEGRSRARHQLGEQGQGSARGTAGGRGQPAEVRAEGSLGEGVDPEQVEGPARMIGRGDVGRHHRRRGADPELPEGQVGAVGQPCRPAHHLMGGPPGHRFRGQLECPPGAGAGEIDADRHRYPEGNAEDGEPDLPRVLPEVAEARPPEERSHRRGCSTSWP